MPPHLLWFILLEVIPNSVDRDERYQVTVVVKEIASSAVPPRNDMRNMASRAYPDVSLRAERQRSVAISLHT